MRDYKTYEREYEAAQRYFEGQIADREGKAFEYGVIVVKNAVLVSGGSLLSIPAIVGLSTNLPVNLHGASLAGLSFACALIVAILGAYIIHVNWTLHGMAWEGHWEDRQRYLRHAYLEDAKEEELNLEAATYFDRSITVTFWVPHVLAVIYLTLISIGFWMLYGALGVAP